MKIPASRDNQRSFAIESCYAISTVGHAISYSTKQPFQHTAILSLENGQWFRYESLVGDGFVRRIYEPRTDVVISEFGVDESTYALGVTWLRNYVGTKYPKPWYLAAQYVLPQLRDMARRSYCSRSAMLFLKEIGAWRRQVGGKRVPKPHPGIPFTVAETLAILRPAHTL
jgi:hypothetical protein